jgi:hypothetical protein
LARLLNRKEIIKENVSNFIEQSSDRYSRFFQGAPNFVTYYSIDRLNSTEDVGLENVVEIVGDESPMEYSRVVDFPLYGIESGDIETQIGDFGMESEYQGTAIVVPGTLKPMPNDFFTFSYNGEYVFKVTTVQVDRIEGKKVYRLEYKLSEVKLENLEKQINKRYETVFDNIGTEDRVVVSEEKVRLLKVIEEMEDSLITYYDTNFRSKKFDVITYKHNGFNLYNSFLVNFIKNNKLLERRYNYMKSIYVNNLHLPIPRFSEIYKKTIYYAIESGDVSNLEWEDFYLNEILNEDTPFFDHYEKFYRCKYYEKISEKVVSVSPHGGILINSIRANTPIDGTEDYSYVLENIIIRYLNDDLQFDEDLLQELNDIQYSPFLEGFLLIPCILFILKDYRKQLIK